MAGFETIDSQKQREISLDAFTSYVDHLTEQRDLEGVDPYEINAELNSLQAANPTTYAEYMEGLRAQQELRVDPYDTVYWHDGDMSGTIG